jgi:putative hydrolase of the HAD superfamily
MSAACEIERTLFEKLYWQFRDDYDSGACDAVQYWTQIADAADKQLSKDQLSQAMTQDNASWSRPSNAMADWAKALRADGIKTAILSNMPLELRKYITACEWLPQFDHSVYSCDVGWIKPSYEIYAHCLQLLGLPANQTLFIDDRQPNIDAARAAGINSMIFTFADLAQFCTALRAHYDLPHPLGDVSFIVEI